MNAWICDFFRAEVGSTDNSVSPWPEATPLSATRVPGKYTNRYSPRCQKP